MKREYMLALLEETEEWQVCVIGGGATGTGIALDSALRGYSTILLERGDFGSGTSSRSTKLVHGGVRYLQQGNISLVLEALKERAILLRNAPHLVHNQSFVVPNYDWWEGPFYGIGLKVYDMLAGKEGFGPSKMLSKEETIEQIPNIELEDLNGGVIYYDGQFDDARLVVNIAQSAAEAGAAMLNYFPVLRLAKAGTFVNGVIARDTESGKEYTIKARVVINATGPWSDQLRTMADPDLSPMIQPSSGVHIVLDRSFLPGNSAIMVPHTDDGRVLFAIPWYNHIIVGTTDTPVTDVSFEPAASRSDRDFLIEHAARYLEKDPSVSDIKSIFAGIRPLVNMSGSGKTSAISRDHTIDVSRSGLVTIAGGKWTTYRKMAQDTVDQAAVVGGLESRPCKTEHTRIHGYTREPVHNLALQRYGSDAVQIVELERNFPELKDEIYPGSGIHASEVVWCARHEMVRTVEDFLSRRRRELILDAKQSIDMVAHVAEILAGELDHDESWQKDQVKAYEKLADKYLCR